MALDNIYPPNKRRICTPLLMFLLCIKCCFYFYLFELRPVFKDFLTLPYDATYSLILCDTLLD